MKMLFKFLKTLKRQRSKKSPFHAYFLGNNLNRFQFGTIQMTISKKDDS